MRTVRINHPALFGANSAATVRFYTEVLGMDIVLRQPNLDNAELEHLFFHVGNDNFIAYFLPYDESTKDKYRQSKHGSGGLAHLAMDVDRATFEEAQRRLADEGVEVTGPVDRGYERSIYFKDPNGVTLEFLTWHTGPPDDLTQADVIARAQEVRVARGAEFVEDEDIVAAVAQLRAERAGGAGTATGRSRRNGVSGSGPGRGP